MRKILFYLLIILGALFLTRNWIAQVSLEKIFSKRLQARVHIDGVHLDLFHTTLSIDRLDIENPAGYPEPNFWRVSGIYVRWNYPALFNRHEVESLDFRIDQFIVVKTPLGGSNLAFFHAALAEPSSFPSFKIQSCRFMVRDLVLKDYSKGGQGHPFAVNPQPIVASQPTDLTGVFRLTVLYAISQKDMPALGIDPNELQHSIRMWIHSAR